MISPVVVDYARSNPRPTNSTGILWEKNTLPNGIGNWEDIAFLDGYFFGVSSAGVLNSGCRSTDGYNWTAINMTAALQWRAIDAGEGVLCAVNDNGVGNQFARSIDHGITWTPVAEPANLLWTDLCYCGASTWIAVASNGVGNQFARSTDNGATWASIAEPANLAWQACVSDPLTGTVICIANNGVGNQIGRSLTRGSAGSWASIAESINGAWNALAFGRNPVRTMFIAVNIVTADAMYSYDLGATWNTTALTTNAAYKCAYGNGRFVVAADSAASVIQCPYSENAIDYNHNRTYEVAANRCSPRAICYGVDRFVVLGVNAGYNVAVS